MKIYFVIGIVILVIFEFFIIGQIKEKFDENDPMLLKLKLKLGTVFPDINTVVLVKSNESYTLDKKKIFMCMTDKNGKYYDENTLTYVLLHELAHVRCNDYEDHSENFHRIFNDLLEIASRHRLYDSSQPIMENYCKF